MRSEELRQKAAFSKEKFATWPPWRGVLEPVTTTTAPVDRAEEMAAVSRTAAAAILLTCFLFGMLLAMTGVRKPGNAALPSPDENSRLRGANDVGVRSPEIDEGFAASPSKIVEASSSGDVDLDEVESMVWPEQQAETRGFWGPDDEEMAQLKGDGLMVNSPGQEEEEQKELNELEDEGLAWTEQGKKTIQLWGPDEEEKKQIAQLLKSGKWSELMAMDEDSGLSFSFRFV